MKKIVALVLALVLALSLATVAFGATKTIAQLEEDVVTAETAVAAAQQAVEDAKTAQTVALAARAELNKWVPVENDYWLNNVKLTADEYNAKVTDATNAVATAAAAVVNAEDALTAKKAALAEAEAALAKAKADAQAALDDKGDLKYSAKTLTAAEAWNDYYGDEYTVSVEAYGSAPYVANNGANKVQYLQEYKVVVTNKETKAQTQTDDFYILAANAKSADLVVVNGNEITYLAAKSHNGFDTVSAVATAVATKKPTADGITCGDIVTATGIKLYKNGSTYYKAAANTASTWMLVDGKAMALEKVGATGAAVAYDSVAAAKAAASDNAVAKVAHKYVIEGTYAKTGAVQTVTKVYCSTCKAEFAFVVGSKSDAVKKFGTNGYVDTLIDTVDGDSIFVEDTSATAAAATGVTSAKTFDAGVALYAGMALMSVAGSAVVIGKKKEF